MKVYVTKYALTRGILLMEVKVLNEKTIKDLFLGRFFYLEGEWFKSELEAIKDAEQRKENKLIQLRNQIEKLEKKNVITIKEL